MHPRPLTHPAVGHSQPPCASWADRVPSLSFRAAPACGRDPCTVPRVGLHMMVWLSVCECSVDKGPGSLWEGGPAVLRLTSASTHPTPAALPVMATLGVEYRVPEALELQDLLARWAASPGQATQHQSLPRHHACPPGSCTGDRRGQDGSSEGQTVIPSRHDTGQGGCGRKLSEQTFGAEAGVIPFRERGGL